MNFQESIIYFENKYNKKINHFNNYEWIEISKFKYLTEEFMEKYQNEIVWGCISEFQKLSEDFIEKYQNKIDWYFVSKCQYLSGEFINKHKKRMDFYYMSKQNKINYLKYQAKHSIISNQKYLKELLKL